MKKYIRLILYAAIGGVLGYSYYYFVGCANGGSCPLTSRWYITTIYGFAAGILMAIPNKKPMGSDKNDSANVTNIK
ncbi:MAG TPA: DUF6132 family protein [Ignavibacteria bacterium]|nr:DUF6132 family protein [Ignavibacteria bacterium]